MENFKLSFGYKKHTLCQHTPGSNFSNMPHDGVDVLSVKAVTNHALFLGGVKDFYM